MDEKNIFKNDEQKKEEDYHFVKEVIKKKTIRPKNVLVRLGCIVGGAVLFGIIAAFVFVRFLPVFQKDETVINRIDFGEDHPEALEGVQLTETAEPAETPMPTPVSEAPPVESAELPAEDEPANETSDGQSEDGSLVVAYEEIYDEMQDIAKNAMRSMVTVTGISNNEDWFAVPSESAKRSSGLIVADDGQELYILTEYKAVDAAERIMVTFCDGSMIDGRYQMHEPNTGLTILKVDQADMRNETRESVAVAVLGNSYGVTQGEAVIAIGSPMGYSNSVVYGQITSTTNIVSTYDRQYNLFTTNMLGSNGGSGAVINLNGEVVSVIAQSFGDEQEENVIIGFPISQLKALVETLSNGGELPCIGVQGQNVTEDVMNETGMPKGVYVSAVESDSPALLSGIRNGDIITKYNGESIETMSQFTDKLWHTEADSIVELTIMRESTEGYREFEFEVTTGTR